MTEIDRQKTALRTRLRKERRRLDPAQLLVDSGEICRRLLELPELRQAKTVFCYVSCGGEVETHRLIEQLLKQGKRVLVPRCKAAGEMDCVAITGLSQLSAGAYGILEPAPDAPAQAPEEIDFSVTPALACDVQGVRLGQGGGYYDRFFQRVKTPCAALCPEQFLLPQVPREAHDCVMPIIVTQCRVLRKDGAR